jgi:hypothetical protein
MNGWFADVIVALIVVALIVLVVNVPGTVKLPIRPFTTLNDCRCSITYNSQVS